MRLRPGLFSNTPRKRFDVLIAASLIAGLLGIAFCLSTNPTLSWQIAKRGNIPGLACYHHEFVFPNHRGLVATMLRVECAEAFGPSDIGYFIFVHASGQPNDGRSLVLRYDRTNDEQYPDVAPRLEWTNDSLLTLSLGVTPSYSIRRMRAGNVRVDYRFGPTTLPAKVPDEVVTADGISTTSSGAASRDAVPISYSVMPIPSWSRLHRGMKVYLSNDERPFTDTEQTVCSDTSAFRAVETGVGSSSRCKQARFGTPVRIEDVVPSRLDDWFYPAPLVKVRTLDGSLAGFTDVLALQPDIPVGATIVMTRKQFPVNVVPSYHWCGACGFDIANGTRVKVLEYDPRANNLRHQLHVRVIDGTFAGREGWVFTDETQTIDSPYTGSYGVDYAVTPELTTLSSDP